MKWRPRPPFGILRLARFWLAMSLSGLLLLAGSVAPVTQSEATIKVLSTHALPDALETLAQVPMGKKLIAHALSYWGFRERKELLEVLRWGSASRTDAVLVRHYNPTTGKEQRERQVKVYLRDSQSFEDLVLDLAHEFIHATTQPTWDPYDPTLTAGKYIWSAIEGDGGEVEAVIAECQVGLELGARWKKASERCHDYLSAKRGTLERDQVRKDFYRVGEWKGDLSARLGEEERLFPLLSGAKPVLYSSTGHAPYPVALYQEFEEITQIACENSRRRAGADPSRRPAAVSEFLTRRCK